MCMFSVCKDSNNKPFFISDKTMAHEQHFPRPQTTYQPISPQTIFSPSPIYRPITPVTSFPPSSSPIDLSPSSKLYNTKSSINSEDGDSDYSYTSSPGHENRPDLSPKMDFRYDCSRHISMLFDFINHTSGKTPHKEFFEDSPAVRAINFDDQNFQPTNTTVKSLTPLQEFVNKPMDDGHVTSETELAGPDIHVCLECGKRYSTSSNLARHRQTHRSVCDKKARKCPHCEKVYVSMPAYSMHVRTHSQGCECPYCGKRFSRPWLLQVSQFCKCRTFTINSIFWNSLLRYKEGNNRVVSVHLKPLVHKYNKAGSKCHTQDNTDTLGNSSV